MVLLEMQFYICTCCMISQCCPKVSSDTSDRPRYTNLFTVDKQSISPQLFVLTCAFQTLLRKLNPRAIVQLTHPYMRGMKVHMLDLPLALLLKTSLHVAAWKMSNALQTRDRPACPAIAMVTERQIKGGSTCMSYLQSPHSERYGSDSPALASAPQSHLSHPCRTIRAV